MLRLATVLNMAEAHELCSRLEGVSIDSEARFESGVESTHIGWNWVSIWIRDDANTLLARALAEAFFREIAERSNGTRCIGCGYDLQGHQGEGKCPECARQFRLPADDRVCPMCNEEVPANFESCWNCGAEMSEMKS